MWYYDKPKVYKNPDLTGSLEWQVAYAYSRKGMATWRDAISFALGLAESWNAPQKKSVSSTKSLEPT